MDAFQLGKIKTIPKEDRSKFSNLNYTKLNLTNGIKNVSHRLYTYAYTQYASLYTHFIGPLLCEC